MSQAKGTVTAVDGDFALVTTEDGGCGRCHESGGCGGANVGRMFCGAPKQWRVLNPRGAQPGERVDIAVADGAVNASAQLLYVLPLILFIVGALGGMLLFGEPGAIAGALLGLVSAWLVVRRMLERRQSDSRFQPYIL